MRRTWSIESFEAIGTIALVFFASGLGDFIPTNAWLFLLGLLALFAAFRGVATIVGRFRPQLWFLAIFVLPVLLLWRLFSLPLP